VDILVTPCESAVDFDIAQHVHQNIPFHFHTLPLEKLTNLEQKFQPTERKE